MARGINSAGRFLRSKRGFRIFLIVCGTALAVLQTGVVGAASLPFTDVPSAYWGTSYIATAYQRGLMVGYGGRFYPDQPVSRAEFAKLIDLALGDQPAANPASDFGDVPSTSWEAGWVTTAAAQGLMKGIGPGTFAPEAGMTRQDAAVALMRAIEPQSAAPAADPVSFLDASTIASYAKGAVQTASQMGLISGEADGRFWPRQELSRAQAAAIFTRYLALEAPVTPPVPPPETPQTIQLTVPVSSLRTGGSEQLTAAVYDLEGKPLNVPVTWSAVGGGQIDGDGLLQATAPGTITITASAGSATAETTVSVQLGPTAVNIPSLPPSVAAGESLPIQVSVVGADGTAMPADGIPIKLEIQGPGGLETQVVTTAAGLATAQWQPTVAGRYLLRASSIGLLNAEAVVIVHASVPTKLSVGAEPVPGPGYEYDIMAILQDKYNNPVAAYEPVMAQVTGAGSLLGVKTAITPQSALAAYYQGDPAATSAATVTVKVGSFTGSVDILPPQEVAGATMKLPAGGQVVAGHSLPVEVTLPGAVDGTAVTLTIVDPTGNNTTLNATASGGQASFAFQATTAGNYQVNATAVGYAPSPVTVTVTAGPPVSLQLVASPSSLVIVERQASLKAFLVDQYGNLTAAQVPVTLTITGADGLGTLTSEGGSTGGVVGVFQATDATGHLTITAESPGYTSATLTLAIEKSAIAGKGLWLMYGDWKTLGTDAIIQKALAAGVTHLYLEVGSTYDNDGFWGAAGLNSLLPAAHRAGLAVIAWIYDTLDTPTADLKLAEQAANYVAPTGDRPDGLTLDLETDENMTAATVGPFDQQLRAALPQELLVACTYPVAYRPNYPFATMAKVFDAFAPMDYWHVRERVYTESEVQNFIAQSVDDLRRVTGNQELLVSVIGQGYDVFNSSGVGTESPSADEINGSLAGAEGAGAVGYSLYRWGTLTPDEWQAFQAYSW